MTGTVISFDRVRCYGFVRAADGRTVFVHSREIVTGARRLIEGERVEFEVLAAPKGPRAVGVTRLAASVPTEGPR